MQNSKILISQALKTIRGNVERTGDPLGMKTVYWNRWMDGLELPREGKTVLFTARMYQMLPYVVQATEMAASAKPFVPMLSVRALSKIAEIANAAVADPVLRLRARSAREIRDRSEGALRGIVSALNAAGVYPAYLHEKEPYSGVLLYDLGMEEAVKPLARSVFSRLKSAGAETVVTVDPHTTFMLRKVYPQYVPGFDLDVRHYLEVLAGSDSAVRKPEAGSIPEKVVLHDSCVMTRELECVEPVRTVLSRLGIEVLEPENRGKDTACCGGPVEYAYQDLSRSISSIRAKELAGVCRDVVVTCPICLVNLMKHEKTLGIRIWDAGEILEKSFDLG
ncbi:MAG TPA: (Fe-S)-binding protein [Desulfobacteraceae bacterium]|nr:(Fe-S)-binding protein [Desulfobacteraceae bacterium]